MGQYQLIALSLVVGPVILLMVLRANATMVFLSLCLGYAVGQLLSSDINAFANLFFAGLSVRFLQIGILVAPAVLTTLFLTRSMKGSRRLLNIAPSLAVGCLTGLLVVPLLPTTESAGIAALPLWVRFEHARALLIGGGAIVSLLFLWLQRPSAHREKPDKKHTTD